MRQLNVNILIMAQLCNFVKVTQCWRVSVDSETLYSHFFYTFKTFKPIQKCRSLKPLLISITNICKKKNEK